jgi:hypothetical protein
MMYIYDVELLAGRCCGGGGDVMVMVLGCFVVNVKHRNF